MPRLGSRSGAALQLRRRLAGRARASRPPASQRRPERFPDVGGAVDDAVGHLGPGVSSVGGVGWPSWRRVAQAASAGESFAERFDVLVGRAALHRDDQGAVEDRVGEVADAGEREGGERGNSSTAHSCRRHRSGSDGAASVAGVDQSTQVLVLLGATFPR